MAAITITPASGSITAKSTVCRVNVTAADSNDTAAYSTLVYPTEPQIKYYLYFDPPEGGTIGASPDVVRPVEAKKSYVFTPGADGKHEFNNFVFECSGAWTIRLRKSVDDSDVATAAVTVA